MVLAVLSRTTMGPQGKPGLNLKVRPPAQSPMETRHTRHANQLTPKEKRVLTAGAKRLKSLPLIRMWKKRKKVPQSAQRIMKGLLVIRNRTASPGTLLRARLDPTEITGGPDLDLDQDQEGPE